MANFITHKINNLTARMNSEGGEILQKEFFDLVANELVTVSDQLGDRRVKIIALTAKGKARFERASDFLEQAFREKVLLGQGQKISAAEIQTFEKVLDKLLAKFS